MTELTLLERVDAILAQHGIISQPDGEDRTTYISCGLIGCRLRISQDERMLRCLISFPIYVPDYQRLAMAEALCRINFPLYSGAMEMDMHDGELRFRNGLPILDSVPTQEQLDWLIFWSWGFARRYSMALLEVAVGACDPEVAVAKVEAVGRQMMLEERQE
jgi:hypothetical protein